MKRPFPPFRVDIDTLLRLATLAVAAAAVMAAFGRYHWTLDLPSHWRLQYVLAAAVLLPCLVFRRLHGWAMVALAIVLLNASGLRSARTAMAASESNSAIPPSRHRLRLAHFNVFVRNHGYERTVEWLRQVKPDVVALVEVTERWDTAMESLKAEFPYRVEDPDWEGGGVALYSRYPFRDSAHRRVGDMSKSVVKVNLAVGDGEVTVIALHPWPPTTSAKAREQGIYLRFAEGLIRDVKGPLIVAGDLNSTPWSHTFTDFVEGGQLTPARALPTWPSNLGFLGIPIDHVLGRSVNIETISTGPRLGSDHLPLLADISF